MSKKKVSNTPEVDYLVNGLEVLFGLFFGLVCLPFRLLDLMFSGKKRQKPPDVS